MRVVGAYCVGLLLPRLGLGWCPEGDGPCWLNIRSKSDAVQHPRGVLFKDGKSSSLGGVAAQSNYVAVLVGGDDAEHEQLRVGSDGKLKLGQGRAAEYTLDVEAGSAEAIASLTGQRRKTGKTQEDGICAAVRLSDIESGESVTLAHDLSGLGFLFGRKGDGLEASKAAVHIHRETPPGSLSMTAEGGLTLSQSGPGASKYPRALFARSRGMSVSAPQIVFKDDILGSLGFAGYDGSKMLSAAKVTVAADGPVAPGKLAARLMFEVAGTKPSSSESGNIRATMTASTFHLQSGTSLVISDDGDVTLESGDLVVGTGSAVIGGLLEVRGGTTVQGPLVAGQGSFKLEDGSAKFNGKNGVQIERGDLTIAEGKLRALEDVEVGGALRVLKNTGTAFSVVGETNFQGSVVASGTSMDILGELRVKGLSQVGDLQASGQATFSGAVNFEKGASLSISHAGLDNEEPLFEVNPSLKKAKIDGEMIVAEGLTCDKLRVVSGGMSVEGEGSLTVSGNMDVGGPVSLASNVVVVAETESTDPSTGALVVKGGLGVEGALSLGDRVYFGKSQVASVGVEEDDTFLFKGNTVVHGTLAIRTVEEDGDDSIRVGNDGTVHALKDVHMTESLAVNGLAKLNNLLVDSNATFSATTEFLGDSSVRGSFSANTLMLTGAASIQGDTSIVSGNLDVKQGILTIGSGGEEEPQLRFAAEEANFFSTLIATKEAVQVNAPATFLEPIQMRAGNLSIGYFTSMEGGDPVAVAELLTTPAQTVLDVRTGEASFLSRGGNLSLTALTDLSLASETRSISLSAPTGNISLGSSQAYLRLSEDGQVELGASEQATVKVQDRIVQVTGEIRAFALTTESLCKSNDEDESGSESVSSCVSFQQDGTLSLANGMVNISIETGRTVMGGSLDLRGPVISSAGYISPPVYIKAESIVELDTAAAYFVLIDDSAAPPSGPVLMALPHEAQAGQTTMVQNQASTGAEIVQRVVQGNDVQVETVAKLEQNAIVKVVFDGEKWKLPSTPHLSSVELHGVSSFVASRDLDIGNFSFAASNVKLHDLAIEGMNDAQQECTDCNEADTSKTQRIALVGTDGTLSASNWTHVSENGTLHVREMAGTTFTGPVQMTGNELRNVSLVGGSIRGVTEFHVAAGMLVSGAVSESSDSRLKTNVSSIESIEALEIVKKMRGVRYDDKMSGEKHIGVIAQEVQELVPEVVSTDDTSGLLAVRYARIVPLLLESVKALEAKVQGLEHKLAALSNVKSMGDSLTTEQVKL